MASGSPLGEGASLSDAMMSSEAQVIDPNSDGSFEFIEIPTSPTSSQISEPSKEPHDLAAAVTVEEQVQIAANYIPLQDSFDSDAQIALAFFAEEQAGNGAFLDNWNPSGVVDEVESTSQHNLFGENDGPDQVADEHDNKNNKDDNSDDPAGYGSPVLRTFKFEAMDEPEPLLVEITLDEDASTSNSTPSKFTGYTEKRWYISFGESFGRRALPHAISRNTVPDNQKSFYPLNKDTIFNPQSASSGAIGDSRKTLNGGENLVRSETPIDSAHDTESLQNIFENPTLMLVIPDLTNSSILIEKPETENITRPPKSVPIINNELSANAVLETTHPDSSEIVFGSIIPENDLDFNGVSSTQGYAGGNKLGASPPIDVQPTGLVTAMDEKISGDSADATTGSTEDWDAEEIGRIRKGLAVLADALAVSSLFLFFSVVFLVALYICFLQLLEIESRI